MHVAIKDQEKLMSNFFFFWAPLETFWRSGELSRIVGVLKRPKVMLLEAEEKKMNLGPTHQRSNMYSKYC